METQAFFNRIFTVAFLVVLLTNISFGQNKVMNENRKKSSKRNYDCKHIGRQKHTVKRINAKETVTLVVYSNEIPKEFYLPKVDPDAENYEFEFVAEVKSVEDEMTPEVELPLPQPVYFRFDTDRLTHDDIHQIALAVEHIKLGKYVILEGHTDSHGAKEYNTALSLKRATMIKNMMIDLGGVSADDISVKYYGEEKEAVANDSDSNRQLNRRVEFVVQQ